MNPEYDQQPTNRDKELKWKIERSSRITASGLAKLNTGGRGKTEIFGKTAIDYIDDIVFQIREKDLIDDIDGRALDWGKDNEVYAIEWLRENVMETVKWASEDFGSDILFMKIDEHFGDSPDGLIYDGDEVIAWLEVKCPYNKKKACNLTLPTVTAADVVDEYRLQLIGHFIGNPNVDKGWYVIYNAHSNLEGVAYNRGRIFVFDRKDFEPSISLMEAKIEKVYRFILLCVAGEFKPEDINSWWVA
jgi:hypothetical protein